MQRRAATEVPVDAKQTRGTWAKPIKRPGCPNLHQVDDKLYRGAQPTVDGCHELKRLGIKTVVNLRRSDTDAQGIDETKLDYEDIPVAHYDATEDEIVRFNKIVTDRERTPVFVHCLSGANRTGMIVAIYRVVVGGWTIDEALKEMREGDYGSYGGGVPFDDYMRSLDVQDIRRRAITN